jgi:CheY-like chemotaxis protein
MAGESTATRAQRVLIADDNDDAATSLAILSKTVGYEVETARDGVQAVEKALTFRPDVVLLDIRMPRLNGYQAAREIRQRRQDEVMLVALSGWDEEAERGTAEDGFDAHLIKPVDLDALSALLEHGIARRTSR